MSKIRQRILENIRIEVRRYLRDGVQMPSRDPMWDSDIQAILREEKILFEQEQLPQIELMYIRFHQKHVSGISFEEWLHKARSLYYIDDSYTVYSVARGPENIEMWPCRSLKEAHVKILKLLYYKQYDHFVRGFNFAYDPDEDID
jgi:hypothetical protein